MLGNLINFPAHLQMCCDKIYANGEFFCFKAVSLLASGSVKNSNISFYETCTFLPDPYFKEALIERLLLQQ